MSYQLVWNCSQPIPVSNFVTNISGTGVLNADKSASATMNLSGGVVQFDARLGGAPRPAPGGTSSIRVAGRDRLQLIWSLRNNNYIVDIRANKGACRINVETRLNPGYHEYLAYNGQMFAVCGKPRVVNPQCRAY